MNRSLLALLWLTLLSSSVWANPSGRRWPLSACGTCPTGTTCIQNRCAVQFRLATSIENTGELTINGGLSYPSFVTRARAAFAAWTSSHVSCPTNWNSVPAASFSTPAGKDAVVGTDRLNNLIWLGGESWPHLANELALTTTTYDTQTDEIFDADMELNNNVKWSDDLAVGTFDLESVLLHEAGHFLGLDHTHNANAVMFSTLPMGASKRVLSSIDQADLCAVYPSEAGGQGSPCTEDEQCTGERICRARAGSSAGICTLLCPPASCPTGYTCQSANAGTACLPQVGSRDLCLPCQSGSECNAGLCLRFEETGVTFCSLTCTESAQCGPQYSCVMPEGYCVPDSMSCTNQCTSTAQCASGYTCIGGTCAPQGETADPCTVSLFCNACNVCTRESADSALSFCRTCCDGMGQGGTCNSCPNTSCGEDHTCAALATGDSAVCIPGSAAPVTCQACNAGRCAEGLQCVGNRCRTSCNPSSPGTCSACFNASGGTGVCACFDEVALEGQPCVQLGNTLAVCATGLECVMSPSPVCRVKCSAGASGTCRTGQSCQSINNVNVCMPGAPGSACAACTSSGSCELGLTCYSGRCYEGCNVNVVGSCSSCIQTSSDGAGLCGCEDQLSPEGRACGTQPEFRACQLGAKCIDAVCQPQCDPTQDSCLSPATCRNLSGMYYCANASGNDGGTTPADGGFRADAGTNSASTNLGCGCNSTSAAVLLGICTLLRRRRA